MAKGRPVTGKHRIAKPRAAAIAAGAATYFTGKPCKHGHVSERDSLGHCLGCLRTTKPRKMRSRRTATGFVYIVSAPNGYVKIGKAENPYGRFGDHQSSSPLLLTLCYVCECSNPVDVEEAVHESLAPHRKHREWFEISTETAINTVRAVLLSAGEQAVAAPHRVEKTNYARPILRANISETTILK